MSTSHPDVSHSKKSSAGLTWVGVALAAMVPGIVLELGHIHASDPLLALIFGIAIVGAAFMLSWAAEVAQLDFSQGLALALLALIAILPEYAVDASFAWQAAREPEYASYAIANMTGANRLLIGIAWPLVIFIAFFRFGRKRVRLEVGHGMEIVVLMAATLYAFTIPLKGNLSLIDLVVLGSLFGFYIWRVARLPSEEPHLVGPAAIIGSYSKGKRRTVTALLTLAAGGAILACAHPFATSLVSAGTAFGIDEFLLVQWLAPLASEAPEFVIVCLFAWRGATTAAFSALISSKINQWTLLVGMLPLIYAISAGGLEVLPLDSRQQQEVLLTAAQSLFAISLLMDLRMSLVGAVLLLGLFLVQLLIPDTHRAITVLYFILTAANLIIYRKRIGLAFKWLRKRTTPQSTA